MTKWPHTISNTWTTIRVTDIRILVKTALAVLQGSGAR